MEHLLQLALLWCGGLAAIILAVYLVCWHGAWFERHSAKLICSAVAVGFGVYLAGYYLGVGDADRLSLTHLLSSAFLALFSTARMFVMESDLAKLVVRQHQRYMGELQGFLCAARRRTQSGCRLTRTTTQWHAKSRRKIPMNLALADY